MLIEWVLTKHHSEAGLIDMVTKVASHAYSQSKEMVVKKVQLNHRPP